MRWSGLLHSHCAYSIVSHRGFHRRNLTRNSFSSRSFTSNQANILNNLQTLGLSSSDFSGDVDCGDLRKSSIFDVAVCVTDDGISSIDNGVSAASRSNGSHETDTGTTSASAYALSSTTWILGTICGVVAVLFATFLFVIHRRKEYNEPDVSIASDTVGCSSSNFSSSDNWHQLLLQNRGRRRTGDVDVFVPRPSSVASMSIPTVTNEENEVFEAPEITTADYSSFSPCTEEFDCKGKLQRRMSIWNDLELVSLQLRASAIEDLKPLGSGSDASV